MMCGSLRVCITAPPETYLTELFPNRRVFYMLRRLADSDAHALIELCTLHWQNGWELGDVVCGDETAVPHKGLFVIRQFIPWEQHSTGVKLYALCDAPHDYIWHLYLYRGAAPRVGPESHGPFAGHYNAFISVARARGYRQISVAYARDTAATDICRYPGHMPRISVGVQVKTLLVYHRKDKEGVEKAAEILARYQKPKELEVPKEEICKESKAEPCVVHASPLKAVKAETVVVLGSPRVLSLLKTLV